MALADPDEAQRILKSAPNAARSLLGFYAKCEIDFLHGLDQQNSETLNRVVQDSQSVMYLLRDSLPATSLRLSALTSVLELPECDGEDEIKRHCIEQGGPLAQRLAREPGFAPGCRTRWLFYQAIGESHGIQTAARDLSRHPSEYIWYFGADCLGRHRDDALAKFDEAVDWPDQDNKYIRLARAHLVADQPNGPQEVRQLTAALTDDDSTLIRRYALIALCLTRDLGEVRSQALKVSKAIQPTLRPGGDVFNVGPCIDYLADEIDETTLLQLVGNHGFATANAQFMIAMKKLAQGHRDEAREHFQACVDTNALGTYDHEWSRAYLTRMDTNPSWPRWISEH